MSWTSSGGHFEHVEVWFKMYNCFNKTGLFEKQPKSGYSGWVIDSLICWSASASNLRTLCIHPTRPPTQIFYHRVIFKRCMRTIHNQLPNSKRPLTRRLVLYRNKKDSVWLTTLLDKLCHQRNDGYLEHPQSKMHPLRSRHEIMFFNILIILISLIFKIILSFCISNKSLFH